MFGFSVYDNEYKECDHAHAVLSLYVIEINIRKVDKDRKSPSALFTSCIMKYVQWVERVVIK